jgi:hypothetical protein
MSSGRCRRLDLLEECILSPSHQDELIGVAEVVYKLSKAMNSPERVEFPLGENCCKENGNFIWYLYPTASISPLPARNAATALMAVSKQLRWPEKISPTKTIMSRGCQFWICTWV